MKVVYETDNGVRFDTQIACESFEKKNALSNHIENFLHKTYNHNYGGEFIHVDNVKEYIEDHISTINKIIEESNK